MLRTWTIFFCAPEAHRRPWRWGLWASRVILGNFVVGGASALPVRAAWMDEPEPDDDDAEPWPPNAPGPEHVYDVCARIGPVFHVRIDPDCEHERWAATVHFYSAADAAALDDYLKNEPIILGWNV